MINDTIEFRGVPVILDHHLGVEIRSVQVRFPRSKKRRIQRKWAKDPRNYQTYRVQTPTAYYVNHAFQRHLVMNYAAMGSLRVMMVGQS